MKTSDFYFNLPEELIAQTPVEPRDSARLLVYDRSTKEKKDLHFFDVVDYLNSGDVLVVNDTKVLPVRLFGFKQFEGQDGAKVEFLLLKRIDYTRWEVLCKPARVAKVGVVFKFSDKLECVVEEILEEGLRVVKFNFAGVFEDLVREIGEMPLPPYIHEKLEDSERYNTIYSKHEGSSAAPTAGLHFTDELLARVQQKGIKIARVQLNVGLGTFRPVKVDDVESHKMHSEYFSIDEATAELINSARTNGNKVFAVGTTSVRVLESVFDGQKVNSGSGDTSIFLYPPKKIKSVDGLITNFHLPESTLIMLVSCLCSRQEILDLYNYAVEEKYRFFSFGDATLII